VKLTHRISRRVGLLLLLPMLATPVLAGAVAFYRHPSLTMREMLRFRLLLSGATERTVDVGGLPVRYFESIPKAPRPSQETLVLVHGFGDSAETWSLVVPRLKNEWRIVAPDLAGFGRTPIPPEGMRFSVLTDYLSRFLDAVSVHKAALAGNSLGGAVAIRYTADHPERVSHLFLLDSAGLQPGATIHVAQAKTREEARQLVKAVSGTNPRYVPNFVLDDIVRRAQEPARQQYRDSDEPTDVREYLSRVKAPTAVVWGELDELIPLEQSARMHAEIEDSGLIVLPGVGHVPQLQAPKRLAEIIRSRLDRLAPHGRSRQSSSTA
jgi:abhydrolase domain-containing protein 6